MNFSLRRMQSDTLLEARLVFFAVCTLFAVAGSRWLPPGTQWLWLAILGIAIAMAHGAFDNVLAEELLGEPGTRWKFAFFAGYVTLAAIVGLLWWLAPVVALLAFLLYSALHFGTESERRFSLLRAVGGLALGTLPTAAACRWWPGQVAAVFSILLRGHAETAERTTAAAGHLLWPAVALAIFASLPSGRRSCFESTALIATELVLFRSCMPIPAFAVFFCLWHTPEHLVSTSLDAVGRFRPTLLRQHLLRGTAPWIVSLAGLATLGWMGRHTLDSYLGVLFIGLSALTVPHMVLGELIRRNQRASAEPLVDPLSLPHAVAR